MASAGFSELIKDLQQDMGSVGDVRDTNRASQMKDHMAMVGEGIGALQWLIMDGKSADFVGEVIGGAQMYGNRVLKAYKETLVASVLRMRLHLLTPQKRPEARQVRPGVLCPSEGPSKLYQEALPDWPHLEQQWRRCHSSIPRGR